MQSTETEVRAQAQRAKTCKIWQWAEGMFDSNQRLRISHVFDDGTARLAGLRGRLKLSDCLPDLSDPGTQGCVIELIARNNPRRSKSDALRDLAHAMSRGLNIEDALVYELESCAAEDS